MSDQLNLAGSTRLQREADLQPLLNLRIHGDQRNPKVVYVEYAPIEKAADNTFRVGTYSPAPESVLRKLGQQLHQSKIMRMPALLGTRPQHVLFYAPDAVGDANLLLVADAAMRFSQFSTVSLVGVLDADLPMPRCVLQVRGGRLNLFALKSDGPVTDASALYIPPTLNVSVTGSVCLGSMIRPKAHDYKSAEELGDAWWDMFFLSKGSHEHGAGLSVLKGKQSLKELYQSFIKKKTKIFPDELLLEVPATSPYKTVGDLRAELIKQV